MARSPVPARRGALLFLENMNSTAQPDQDDVLRSDTTCIVRGAIEHVSCRAYGRCKQPYCLVCEWVKAKKIVSTVDGLTGACTGLWSITLTVRPSSASLKKQTKE